MDLMKSYKYNLSDDNVSVVFVGDAHFSHVSPKSRIDDYPATCCWKLAKLRNLCQQRGFSKVVFLGDVFHRPLQPVNFLNKLIIELEKFREVGIDVFSVTGNHELKFDRLESVWESSLGTMYLMDLIKPFKQIEIITPTGKLNLYGFHYSESPLALMDQESRGYSIGDYNVMVAHMFYEYDLTKDSLKEKDIKNLGYDMYVLGHEHASYDLLTVDKVSIVRPGSFMRGTSHKYNLTRDVYVDVVRYKNRSVSVERITLDVQPPELVFSASATDKVDLKSLSDDLKSQFNSLITMLETPKTEGTTVYKIMDDMVIQPKVKSRIEHYLEEFGVFRPSINS